MLPYLYSSGASRHPADKRQLEQVMDIGVSYVLTEPVRSTANTLDVGLRCMPCNGK